jgi:DNA modification methylase
MGVGTTGIAAKKLSRNFIGIESNKTFYDTAVKLISETKPIKG